MKSVKIAAIGVVFGLWAGAAQAAMLSGAATLVDRSSNASIEPVADLIIVSTSNSGKCTLSPPDWDLIWQNGIYYYEFCNYPAIPNYLWIDVHKKPDSAGNFGKPVSSYPASCGTWPDGYVVPPAKAKQLFCHD